MGEEERRSDLPIRTAPRPRGQSGYSLVEVLVAVLLVGTVLAALAGGMLTMMLATASTSEQQRLEAGVLNYTQVLRSRPYVDCARPSSFPTWEQGGVRGRVDAVRYWNVPGGQAWGGASAFQAGCSTDQGRQLLDVTLELVDGAERSTAQVVVRKGP
jgi:prepilin-type N-terminal cleavage/methylation domain-containing protein